MHFPGSDPPVLVAHVVALTGKGWGHPISTGLVWSIPSTSDTAVSPLLLLLRHPKGCLCPIALPFLKKKEISQKTTIEAGGGNCFKFLYYLMEQKCFLRLFREREGQMSLINTDLLRGLGSGKERQSSCPSQCTRSRGWDAGWEARAGPLAHEWGGGFSSRRCGRVRGAVHPRRAAHTPGQT